MDGMVFVDSQYELKPMSMIELCCRAKGFIILGKPYKPEMWDELTPPPQKKKKMVV